MSSRNNNRRSGGQRGGTTPGKQAKPPAKSTPKAPSKSTAKPAKEAELVEAAEALEAVEPEPVEGGEAVPPSDVTGAVDADRLRRALAQVETARKRVDLRTAALEKKQDALDTATAKLAQDRAELQEHLAELQRREDATDQAEKDLAERREQLVKLEEEAKRDFAGYRQEQLDTLRGELEDRRTAFDERLRGREAEHDAQYANRESTWLARNAELDEREAAQDRKRLEQQRLERRLGAREEHLDQEVDDRIRDRLATLESELERTRQHSQAYQERLETMRGLAEQRTGELAEHERAMAELGRPAPEVAKELRRLQAENRELREDAAAHPIQDRGAEFQARYHDLAVDYEALLQKNEELRRYAAAGRIATTERENASMINEALQRQNDTLTHEIDQQSARLKEMQAIITDSPPFPACSEMDETADYQARPELDDEAIGLRDFIGRVRERMALEFTLFYAAADLRCFVAGLAASRLHLLEGISGIGKTRLPEAFAQLIGAGRETVAVAAEWRSPQDLLGYYNAFERKFYESEFTRSLYKARLPLFREKPFFVVLDEMNLSHPEQYFSDLLSAIARKEADPRERPLLPLMTAPVSPPPKLLREGRALELPENVWFVGTANNDETTVRFADKTYDRAHVLELPVKPRRFTPKDSRPFSPISYQALTRAFDAAEKEHGSATEQVLTFLDGKLGERLRDDFGVASGNRLERQAKRFVPVTVAAGGHAGEAADHLLATKVLRKLAGRVEINPAQLRELRKEIDELWAPAFPKTAPVKSRRVLDEALRSLGQV